MTYYPLRFEAALFGIKVIATLPLLLSLASTSMAALIVTPGGYETREGNYADAVPFGTSNRRLQQVISAQEFLSISGPLLIRGMALREDTNGGSATGAFLTNQINLSTTSRGPDSLSPIFAENIGLDETVVLPGDRARAIGHVYVPGLPTQPFIPIFFEQPFFYDPQAGNLLIEIRNYGGTYFPPNPIPGFDGVFQQGDGVSWVLGDLPDSPMGRTVTPGYVIQFEYTLVPEPSSLALFGIGAVIAGAFAWCKQRHI